MLKVEYEERLSHPFEMDERQIVEESLIRSESWKLFEIISLENVCIKYIQNRSRIYTMLIQFCGYSQLASLYLVWQHMYLMFASKTCTVESLSKDTVSITSLTALWNSVTLPSTCREFTLYNHSILCQQASRVAKLLSGLQIFCSNSIFVIADGSC